MWHTLQTGRECTQRQQLAYNHVKLVANMTWEQRIKAAGGRDSYKVDTWKKPKEKSLLAKKMADCSSRFSD